jgi:hypothetical protein
MPVPDKKPPLTIGRQRYDLRTPDTYGVYAADRYSEPEPWRPGVNADLQTQGREVYPEVSGSVALPYGVEARGSYQRYPQQQGYQAPPDWMFGLGWKRQF